MRHNETLRFGEIVRRAGTKMTLMVVNPHVANRHSHGWFSGVLLTTSSTNPIIRAYVGTILNHQRQEYEKVDEP